RGSMLDGSNAGKDRVAAEKAMAATAKNTKTVLLICVAYTSYDEIVHAVQESCNDKRNEIEALYASKVSNGVTEGVEEGENINGTIEHDVQGSCENSLSKSQALNTTRACNGVIRVEKKKGVILHAVQSCEDKWDEVMSRTSNGVTEGVADSKKKQWMHPTIKLVDIEKNMYMGILIMPVLFLNIWS
ncbi:hypothetical protein CMV_028084, partial [Castanea mollissima]